ncbi:MAG: UDP-N-acetylmuramoyl-tripeptide--D-alanyl-D-alanine ligase [Flavobacteriales bacterium]
MDIKELYRIYLASSGVSTDSRKITKDCLFFALRGESFDGNCFASESLSKGALAAVVDDERYRDSMQQGFLRVEDSLIALQTLAAYHRKTFSIPLIAITGSNGKTTTKELLTSVLSKKFKTYATEGNLNNHIGVPLTLLAIPADAQMAIVEMGANHQKEIEFLCTIAQPDYGYITNFGQAHLEGFGSFEGVIRGKSELYQYLRFHNKKAFINADDPIQMEKSQGIRRYGFSQRFIADIQIRQLSNPLTFRLVFDGVEIHPQLIGRYNFTNMATVIAIGNHFGVPADHIKAAIESYTPVNNRSQLIQRGGLRIILDAYNANPSSMREALLNFTQLEGYKTVILGDMFELGALEGEAHEEIVRLAQMSVINSLLLVGERFNQVSIADERVTRFRDRSVLIRFLQDNPITTGTLLIKGSRKMALERLLEVL